MLVSLSVFLKLNQIPVASTTMYFMAKRKVTSIAVTLSESVFHHMGDTLFPLMYEVASLFGICAAHIYGLITSLWSTPHVTFSACGQGRNSAIIREVISCRYETFQFTYETAIMQFQTELSVKKLFSFFMASMFIPVESWPKKKKLWCIENEYSIHLLLVGLNLY